ncbi:membrane protein [Comamonas thiooxydans]|nr:membrane protein [Comamonas thiooxydans]KGG99519.1 membrane protein [Comamonas thiooxydans]KGH03949.1 membrane protein [Comamonas thiooxydans]KGH11317.1 membrane protein [Comamonas thiooxydans]
MDDLFAEVDLSGIATKVTALAVVIVGIALVMKGPAIVKRIIAKI